MNTKLKLEELKRIDIQEFKESVKIPVWLVLDNIRSLQNIGSIFRTADAFRVEEILLCGITACPPHREISKAALGATESVNWKYFEKVEEVVFYCRSKQVKLFCLEQTSESFNLTDEGYNHDKMAFVLGNEIDGVSEKFIEEAERCLEIPQFGTKHSFNVSTTVGIALWDYFLKRGKFILNF